MRRPRGDAEAVSALTTQTARDGRLTRHLVPADSTDLADILDEELSRGSRHGIYLRALAAAEALM